MGNEEAVVALNELMVMSGNNELSEMISHRKIPDFEIISRIFVHSFQ